MGNRIRTEANFNHTPAAAAEAAKIAGGHEGYEDGVRRGTPKTLPKVAVRAVGVAQPSLLKEFPTPGQDQLRLDHDPNEYDS